MIRRTCIVFAALAAWWLLGWGPLAPIQTAQSSDATPPGQSSEVDTPGQGEGSPPADPAAAAALTAWDLVRANLRKGWTESFWGDNWPVRWAIFLLAIFLGLLAGRIGAGALRRVADRLQRRGWVIRAHVPKDLVGPAKLALLTVGLSVGLGMLDRHRMGTTLETICAKSLLLLYTVAVFWYAFNLVSAVDLMLRRMTAKTNSSLDGQLIPLIRKTLRIFLVAVGVMFVVDSVFGQDVGALLAGLGIAGLAVSLAAQDSLKNLFGSITILFDRPFKIGERIVYAGYDGTIEEIGFRSTKVRTLTGHLVTIPNSKIVSDPIENIGRRPSIRRIMNVTITYDTPREKIERAVAILRGILEEEDLRGPIHQTINGEEFPPRVYFNDYNPDSLNIILIYWYAPPAYWDYVEHAQKLNLRIFEEFEKAGIEFAFPTQTLYLAGDPKREMGVRMLGKDL